MENNKLHFRDITLLITHYNRSTSLCNLLTSFKKLNCYFGDIIVSDDGSTNEHLTALRTLQKTFAFRLVTTPQNRGLGNNINKGQDEVHTPYTLYIQEDFIPQPSFPAKLKISLDAMEKRDDLDIVRLHAYVRYPYLKPCTEGFSEMHIPPFARDYTKIYAYSDHPHLRRSSFLTKFGRYRESTKSDKTEYLMCLSFIKKKGKGLFYNDFKGLLSQENSKEEPSTVKRIKWRQSQNPLIRMVRNLYRQIKYNYDIYIS